MTDPVEEGPTRTGPVGEGEGATVNAGPLDPTQRSPAPDAARGLALLGIALANSVFHISGLPYGDDLRPLDGSGLDHAVAAVITLLVDARTLPAFALMLGYGAAVILRRQEASGASWRTARGVLVRRWLWLGVFGAVHIVLLWDGDILLQYAVTGLLLVLFLRRSGRTLLVWAGVLIVLPLLLLLLFVISVALDPGTDGWDVDAALAAEASEASTLLAALGSRVAALLSGLVLSPVLAAFTLPPVLLGVWAARHRVLERPEDHRGLLRWTAAVGLVVSIAGGAPQAMINGRLWEPSARLDPLVWGAHSATGVFGGAAFVALVALVVVAAGGPARTLAGRGVRAVLSGSQAVGARSLTCYLAQSVLFVLPLAPWAGGLGVGMPTSVVALWAVGVWLVTLGLAVWLRSVGRSGPAEALLRRRVYRQPARPDVSEREAARA